MSRDGASPASLNGPSLLFGNRINPSPEQPRRAWLTCLESFNHKAEQRALAPFSSPDERCYSFCFSDYEISHFLGSLFIESAAHMQR